MLNLVILLLVISAFANAAFFYKGILIGLKLQQKDPEENVSGYVTYKDPEKKKYSIFVPDRPLEPSDEIL